MTMSTVKLNQGIHVMHLFYRVERLRWAQLAAGESAQAGAGVEALCAANAGASHPRLLTYANVSGKADLVFMLQVAELGQIAQLHRDLEACFAPGTLTPVFSYLSVTELSEYMPTEERRAEYEHYRLYPELPDWEVMGFYPMSKRRNAGDNWYSLDFAARKRLMGGHARVGRKYAGRVSQLITGSTGLDEWAWGVTLMAHQVDALKEIVYEMRFDEVTARYGEFGPFYVNLRLPPAALWKHLHL